MKKKGEKQADKQSEELKSDQKLQAILLADSFEKNFRPLTLQEPKVLLPLVNTPMLEYTLEFLSQNGVEEVFIFCVWHAEIIENYVKSSKWHTILTVHCITSASCTSAGDALRELDSLGVIRSDPFILVSGDVISNMDLRKAIAFHQEKRKMDPNTVMTVSLKKVQKSGAGARSIFDDLTVAMNNVTGQILVFDDNYEKTNVSLPIEIISEHPKIVFRSDLLDCHVDICSPDLMLQFSDNFDYQDIRHDFIKNEVLNWELGMHIYGYTIENEYAARVHDPRTYHHITRDVVTRWVYPLVPDSKLVKDSNYIHMKQYNYRDKDCVIARSVRLGEVVVIGRGTKIDENCIIDKSIIGRKCVIDSNVEITESHIWDGCIIESGAKITKAILAKGVIVRKNSVIPQGCILSYGVTIGENITLSENTRLSITPQDNDTSEATVVGEDGKGFLWTTEVDPEEAAEEDVSTKLLERGHSIGGPDLDSWRSRRWETMPAPADDFDDNDDDGSDFINGDDGSDSHSDKHVRFTSEDDMSFRSFIRDIIKDGYEEGNEPDTVILEIKRMKFGKNKTFSDCVRESIKPLLDITTHDLVKQEDITAKLVTLFRKEADGWCYKVLRGLIQDEEDEMTSIESVEDYLLGSNTLSPSLLRYILHVYYKQGLVSKQCLQDWISNRRRDSSSKRGLLFQDKEIQKFIDILEDEFEDEDDDDNDEDCSSATPTDDGSEDSAENDSESD